MAETKKKNWGLIIQTIILVVTLIGIAISADRRVTVVEDTLATETELRKIADANVETILEKLQSNEQKVIENQARVTALLEVTMKRHELEDARKGK